MDYTEIHNIIINRARNRVLEGYCERHHIIPRCMGGTDDADNIIELTAREHYIVHQLLVKIHPKNRKLVKAAKLMAIDSNGNRTGNKLYGWLKKKKSEDTQGKTYIEIYGNQKATAIKKKRSKTMTGIVRGPQTKKHKNNISKALSGSNHPGYGKHPDENTRAKMRAAATGKISGMASNWLLVDPNGSKIYTYSLRKYCRDIKLPYSRVRRELKGWQAKKLKKGEVLNDQN